MSKGRRILVIIFGLIGLVAGLYYNYYIKADILSSIKVYLIYLVYIFLIPFYGKIIPSVQLIPVFSTIIGIIYGLIISWIFRKRKKQIQLVSQ